jgi:outer membrane protein TolC
MPLRLSEARGEYRQATLKIDQTRLQQANKQVQIYNKVRQYFVDREQTTIQLRLQEQLLDNFLKLQKAEETRFANGESTLFLINARELKAIEARQKLIELQSKNRKAELATRWAAGTLW